jgi:predicted secreted hydrolase
MRSGWLAVVVLLMWPAHAWTQGFAGLGAGGDGFAAPVRDKAFAYPADHGPHTDFRVEWWYITANLDGADGREYGVQWTLFRTAIAPGEAGGWTSPQMWMGHAALTTPARHYAAERLGRGGTGQAGVEAQPFKAWIDDWEMRGLAPAGADAISDVALRATGAGFSYALRLTAEGPIVLQGDKGYSVKSASGQASHYYSQPFYTVTGSVQADGRDVKVTGRAWLDREWSSQPLAADQRGWDWFSLHLDDGDKLMGFRLRDEGKGYTSGTWISADGTPEPLAPGDLRVEPLRWATTAGRRVPVEWRVRIPSRGLDVSTRPLTTQAWMPMTIPYWEGPIRFRGSHTGRGYLEMTGYE